MTINTQATGIANDNISYLKSSVSHAVATDSEQNETAAEVSSAADTSQAAFSVEENTTTLSEEEAAFDYDNDGVLNETEEAMYRQAQRNQQQQQLEETQDKMAYESTPVKNDILHNEETTKLEMPSTNDASTLLAQHYRKDAQQDSSVDITL